MQGLVLIDNKENNGKGYVVRQGMLAARGKFRLFMDSDHSVSIEYVEKFLPYFSQGYDVVIASIELRGDHRRTRGVVSAHTRALCKTPYSPARYLGDTRYPAGVQDLFRSRRE